MLLKEFRETRQHMAIVIDEYGSVCGAVTIEDVLEQIVGEIEDEFDVDDDSYIKKFDETNYIVKALTPLDEFNDYFDTEFSDQEFTTLGGLILQQFGRIPERSESVILGTLQVTVLNADSRQIKLLKVSTNTLLDSDSGPSHRLEGQRPCSQKFRAKTTCRPSPGMLAHTETGRQSRP